MSNEPTVTRTMRCPACSVVGTHTINASMANESVLCPACAESGKRSTCVAVEPTEEQREAVARFYYREEGDLRPLVSDVGLWVKTGRIGGGAIDDACISLARLLAEREAKAVARIKALANDEIAACGAHIESLESLLAKATDERDTLRARVAELEGQVSESTRLRMTETLHGMGVEAMYQEREAQHLADIKALMAKVRVAERMRKAVVRVVCSPSTITGVAVPLHLIETLDALNRDEADFADVLARLAHYDDAKADAPAVDWQAWANGSCPEPGCSLANPHEQGVACVKPTAEGGE